MLLFVLLFFVLTVASDELSVPRPTLAQSNPVVIRRLPKNVENIVGSDELRANLRKIIEGAKAVQKTKLPNPVNPQITELLKAAGIGEFGDLFNTPANNQLAQLTKQLYKPGSSGGFNLEQLKQAGILNPDGAMSSNLQLPVPSYQPPGSEGLLGMLGGITRRFTSVSGLQSFLNQVAGTQGGVSLPRLPPLFGSQGVGPVFGMPEIPGLSTILNEGLPTDGSGQIDYAKLIAGIGKQLMNGSTLADIIPAGTLQELTQNLTDSLLPNTAELDLKKFMGRWFEGFNTPRSTDQYCVVHHYIIPAGTLQELTQNLTDSLLPNTAELDLKKFMGRWFEGFNTPRSTDQYCVVHPYGGLTESAHASTFTALKIYRAGSEYGEVRYGIGYTFRNGERSSMLTMHSSEQSEAIPFWVYLLGPETTDEAGASRYEYAVVSNWVRYPVTVLVRDPDTFKAKYAEEVLDWMQKNGFVNGLMRVFNLMRPASYEGCQYSEATFKAFG